jgi:iron(III) transport system permease protein
MFTLNAQNSFFYIIALIILMPLFALGLESVSNDSDVFGFLVRNVLDDVVLNSVMILVLSGLGVLGIGISCAWFNVHYSFWGRCVFQWMLFMPLAFPSYILAYVYTDFFDQAGALAGFLRTFGFEGFLPDIRTVWGASFILTFCLYPYVYLFARNGFLAGSKSQIEGGRLLGAGVFSQFFDIALPAARPFIIVGLMLVTMEVLADYGTMDYFGIKVFSTVIYDAWAGYGDITAAARLSLILLAFVLLLVWTEKIQRGKMRFYASDSGKTSQEPSLNGHLWMSLWCFIPVFIGFVFPSILLVCMVFETFDLSYLYIQVMQTLPYLLNSLIVCSIVAVVGVMAAFTLSSYKRNASSRATNFLFNLCGFGYALPGIILGLGLLLVSSLFSQLNILVTGTFVFLIVGYIIRFLNVALQSLDAGFDKISPSIDQASALMRHKKFDDFWQIKLPLLTPAMLSAGLILAVEVIKELPLTLVLRPFDFDTLAVHTYNLASDERLAEAAFPALCIVVAGCIPILLLQRLAHRSS